MELNSKKMKLIRITNKKIKTRDLFYSLRTLTTCIIHEKRFCEIGFNGEHHFGCDLETDEKYEELIAFFYNEVPHIILEEVEV